MGLSNRQVAFFLFEELLDVHRRIREFTGEADNRKAVRALKQIKDPHGVLGPGREFWSEGEWINAPQEKEPQVGSRTSVHTVGSAGLPTLGKR